MAILDDLATFLDAQSTAFTLLSGTAGNLLKSQWLDNAHVPDTVTVLYETQGFANSYVFSTSTGTASVSAENAGVQVLSRSTSYQTARSRAQTAYTILDGLAGRRLPTSTGTLYIDISANQAPFLLQRDENRRFIVAVNFTVRKEV